MDGDEEERVHEAFSTSNDCDTGGILDECDMERTTPEQFQHDSSSVEVERGIQSKLNIVDQIVTPTSVYCSPGGECYHTSRICEGLKNVLAGECDKVTILCRCS